jgi:putative DNA primase/helicase
MSDTRTLDGVFAKLDPLAGVTADDVGPEIAAAIGLQSLIEKDTAELLEICKQWVRRYVIVSDEQAVILAAWILHTWTFEAAETTPYIHITAPERECGKSRLMETLAALACGPVRSGGMTAAALVRCIDAKNPTIFLDEMDAQLSGDKEYAEAIRGILNEGFRKSGKFFKCDGKNNDLREFNAYCPKCFAGIGKMPETVSSRSIAIEMRRKTDTESVKPLRQRETRDLAQPIRARLEAWKLRGIVRQLETSRPAAIDGLGDRQNDISEPLLAIAESAGGDWVQRLTSALLVVLKRKQRENVSTGVTLLIDIRAIFQERKAEKIFSKELAAALCEIEGRPWADWSHGKGFQANDLAKQLARYDVHPRKISIATDKLQGYFLDAFEDAWKRYCPAPPDSPGTPELSASLLAKSGSGTVPSSASGEIVKNHSNPHEQRRVPTVPAVPAIQGQRELRL